MASKQPLFAFFGTPSFVIPALESLERHGLLPALVITAPARPRGRGLELSPTPVNEWAAARGIDVLTPETLKDESLVADLQNTDWDFFVVASYGKLLPRAVLDIPRRGCLNIHPSMLPQFRGPSPVISAILADQRQTGVTIMEMAEQMDAGPIVVQARIEIDEADWPLPSDLLTTMLFSEGGNLLAEVLPQWLSGTLAAEAQEGSLATYTKKFSKEDAQLDLSGDARQNLLKIRAFDKNPRAYFMHNGKRVVVTGAHLEGGALVIERVIPEGKKEMPYEDFMRSH